MRGCSGKVGPLPWGWPSPVLFTEERQACVSLNSPPGHPAPLPRSAWPPREAEAAWFPVKGRLCVCLCLCVCVWDLCLAQEAENSRHLPSRSRSLLSGNQGGEN